MKEKPEFVEELRTQWKDMWQRRIDDRLRAEGIADNDYSLLFVDRGTVITATRNVRSPDFFEILQQHRGAGIGNMVPPSSGVGGWGKFIRTVVKKQLRLKRQRRWPLKPVRKERRQLKKGGRGWLHRV
jgi:hypothetical protein